MVPVPHKGNYDYLYPHLDDERFNEKIAMRKEFRDTTYQGDIAPVEEMAEKLCNATYELAPHQQFVRNFLSSQTPYNSLLLYHGLGSGKTCSAISVAEEARDFIAYSGAIGAKKIIVIASPNVQENFRQQLFDERNLKFTETHGWVVEGSCAGNKILKEIMASNKNRLTRDKKEMVIRYINRIIKEHYMFKGYEQFYNYFKKKTNLNDASKASFKKQVNKVFGGSIIIVDEAHNIRSDGDNSETKKEKQQAKTMKGVMESLQYVASHANNVKLLFLSATPMYNSPKEIVGLLNLMIRNDGRVMIGRNDVFDSAGNLKVSNDGQEIGRELLERKARGYISFVRGENPYTFPYRIWPQYFDQNASLLSNEANKPVQKLNGTSMIQGIENLDVFVKPMSSYQEEGYNLIFEQLKRGENGKYLENDKVSYNIIQKPIEALNIVYPHDALLSEEQVNEERMLNVDIKELVGKGGLERIMKYTEEKTPLPRRYDFEYMDDAYGDVFSPDQIGKYSSKIKTICERIVRSEGIVLVYSQFIDGGLVPLALALEQLGFRRAGTNGHMFKKSSLPKKRENKLNYAMITGDKSLSPDNARELKLVTNSKNKDGQLAKVVLISQAGSEGLDFKCIRQVHIMEPWYNMNRIEQIIGRAVRTCSHKQLPFAKRNVEIYLHCLASTSRVETADMYLYRKAEAKAVQIGVVSRILKQVSTDCLLNIKQSGFTEAAMNQVVKLELSSRNANGTPLVIDYQVGDKPYSSTCDYMERCEYKCKSVDTGMEVLDTYNKNYMYLDIEQIKTTIRALMVEHFFYRESQLVGMISATKPYPQTKIDAALNDMIDKREPIVDKFGRLGTLIRVGSLYLFQPKVLENKHISVYERTRPVEKKIRMITVKVPKSQILEGFEEVGLSIYEEIKNKYNYVLKLNKTLETKSTFQQKTYTLLKKAYANMITDGKDPSLMKKLLVARLVEELKYDDLFSLLSYFVKYEQELIQDNDELGMMCISYYQAKTHSVTDNTNISYFLYNVNKDGTYKAIKINKETKECVKAEELARRLMVEATNDFKKLSVHLPYRFMGYVKPEDEVNVVKLVKEIGLTGLKDSSPERAIDELEYRYQDATQKNGKRWFLTLVEHAFIVVSTKAKNTKNTKKN